MKRKTIISLVLGALILNSSAANIFAEFVDVPKDNYAYNAIEKLYKYGLTNGVGENKFNPDGELTRAQAAVFLAKAIFPGEEPKQDEPSAFSDVPKNYFAKPYINLLKDKNIIAGVGKDKFAPNAKLTAVQFETMLVRGLNYDDGQKHADWKKYYNEKASEIGLRKDFNINNYDTIVKRADVAVLISNALEIKPNKQDKTLLDGLIEVLKKKGLYKDDTANSNLNTAVKSSGISDEHINFVVNMSLDKLKENPSQKDYESVQSFINQFSSNPHKAEWEKKLQEIKEQYIDPKK